MKIYRLLNKRQGEYETHIYRSLNSAMAARTKLAKMYDNNWDDHVDQLRIKGRNIFDVHAFDVNPDYEVIE